MILTTNKQVSQVNDVGYMINVVKCINNFKHNFKFPKVLSSIIASIFCGSVLKGLEYVYKTNILRCGDYILYA